MAVNLTSKSARAALKPRREPYWERVRIGLYLGFRRSADGAGTWIGRQLEPGTKAYLLRSFGALPGHPEALKALNAWGAGVDVGASHKATLVADVCRAYVAHQRTAKSLQNAADAAGRFRRLVYEAPIGRIALDKLRTSQLRAWLEAQLDEDGDDEDLRRSKDSANRNLSAFKAALNLALRDRLVASDAGWKTVTPFVKAGRRRERFLTRDERAQLLEACEPDLRAFATGLLLTAARPGELAACTVGDFDRRHGTLVLSGKTGRRIVALSTAARAFLAEQATGKTPAAPLLATTSGGANWSKDGWKDRLKAAVRSAALPDDVVAYTLRHCAISELVMAGVDSLLVAKTAGTSIAMIEKHYAHLRHENTRERLDAVRMI